jgi:hypothetical protein
VLAELHDWLDAPVLQADGWSDLAAALVGQPGGTLPWPEKPAAQAAAEEDLLLRLVAFTAERAADEARGTVRWLQPEFQDPARRGAAPRPRSRSPRKTRWTWRSMPPRPQPLRRKAASRPLR